LSGESQIAFLGKAQISRHRYRVKEQNNVIQQKQGIFN